MNESPKTFLLGVGEIPTLIEQEFNEVLIEPDEGYYSSTSLEPLLPYRNKSGMPASYWIQETSSPLSKREVQNLALVKGLVFDEEGDRKLRLYRPGDLQLTPQIPVIGHLIVKEYLQTFLEMSRCWYKFTDNQVFGTGSLHKRFKRFIKHEYMETFDEKKFDETSDYLNEVTMEYMRGIIAVPAQDHLFGIFLDRILRLCYTIVQPMAGYIVDSPWKEFELQRIGSNDFLVIDKGDYRVNAWEAQHLNQKKL